MSRAEGSGGRDGRHVTDHDELPPEITLQHEVLPIGLAGFGFQSFDSAGIGAFDTLLKDGHLDTHGHVDHGAAAIGQLEADVLGKAGGREEGNEKDGMGKSVVHAVAFVCFNSDQFECRFNVFSR